MSSSFHLIFLIVLGAIRAASADDISQLTTGDCSPAISNVGGNVTVSCRFYGDRKEYDFGASMVRFVLSKPMTMFVVLSEGLQSMSISLDGINFYPIREAPFVGSVNGALINISTSDIAALSNGKIYFSGCYSSCKKKVIYPIALNIKEAASDSAKSILLLNPYLNCIGHQNIFSTSLRSQGMEAVEALGYRTDKTSNITYWFQYSDAWGKFLKGENPGPPAKPFILPNGVGQIFISAKFVDGSTVGDIPVKAERPGDCHKM